VIMNAGCYGSETVKVLKSVRVMDRAGVTRELSVEDLHYTYRHSALQDGEPLVNAPRLVIGAGTGLGMAVLVREGDGWRVLPGEGGHVGFAPLDEDQDRVCQALRREYGRVTAERIVSGPGLTATHRILTGASLDAGEITRRALFEADEAALDTLNVFLTAYGAFAGDMAMALLARGGVYLAGGIAAKLLPILPASPLLTAFNAKAEHAGLVRRMPVAVVTDPSLGLRGAACLAIPYA